MLAPDEIASVLMGTDGSATIIFADKLDAVMLSLMQASGGDAMDNSTSIFSPPGLLWSGGTMLLLGTVGVLATTKIALAILMGIGPIFILMALFDGTKGLFVGWLKGVVLMALAPLFAVLGGSLMLELAIPVLSSLAASPGEIDVRPAMAFFMIGAVHLALMFMIMKVAHHDGERLDGVRLCQQRPGGRTRAMLRQSPPMSTMLPAQAAAATSARERVAQAAASAPSRDIRVTGATLMAANDSGPASTNRETRIVSGPGGAGSASGNSASPISRARGIGSRFKSAPIRSTEKNP